MAPTLFDDPQPSELDELWKEIDREVDHAFLADLAPALETLAPAEPPAIVA